MTQKDEKDPEMPYVGRNIRSLRVYNNMSQIDLSFQLEISRQQYSNIESSYAPPATKHLIRLARIFKISLDELCFTNVAERLEAQKLALNNQPVLYPLNQPTKSFASDYKGSYTAGGEATTEGVDTFEASFGQQVLDEIERGRLYPAAIVRKMMDEKDMKLLNAQKEIWELKNRLKKYEELISPVKK